MSKTIRITVDGQATELAPGTMLLDAMRALGVGVPMLCHHPSVEPSGACRLCTVEITHADWGGWSGLVTSCLYPVADDGLQVSTRSDRVRRTRAGLLELYLSRCPDSPEVAALARSEGVDTTRYPACRNDDNCVQCGLCIRVCRERSVDAIAPLGRGTGKTVGPGPSLGGAHDCVGCLACAHVCPTGHITTEMIEGVTRIWEREFKVALCSVERDKCRSCGACERACPLAIPRVSPNAAGEFAASIAPQLCVGCGLCVGACPTGAISQKGSSESAMFGGGMENADLRDRTLVFACSRSDLSQVPEGTTVIPVSCVGRVGIEHILTGLARGARGVQLLCRDRDTCPFEQGGHDGESRAVLSERLAMQSGLGEGRVAWTRPPSGHGGPAAAVDDFAAGLGTSPLTNVFPMKISEASGLDLAHDVLNWLREKCPELTPVPPSLTYSLPETAGAESLLYVGDLLGLNQLIEHLGANPGASRVLIEAAAALDANDIPFRIATTRADIEAAAPCRVILPGADMLTHVDDLPAACDLVTVAELCGESAPATVDIASITGKGFRFRLSPDERRRLDEALRSAGDEPVCASPYELLQIELLTRAGSWRTSDRTAPTMVYAPRRAAGEER